MTTVVFLYYFTLKVGIKLLFNKAKLLQFISNNGIPLIIIHDTLILN